MDAVVEVTNLRKVYAADKRAVDGITFEVQAGETVGLLGPNGAGKTTIIHTLLGLTTPSSGSIRIFGLDQKLHLREILQRCNFASAFINLPANLTVWENLRVSALLYGIDDSAALATDLLERFEIAHLRRRISGHLSAGETTRLNLCKALLNAPDLLLLDEPTASLDPNMADKLRKALRALQADRGLAMIYTSHNMRDVEEVCDRVIFMNEGRAMAEGTPGEVVARFKQRSLEDVFIRVARGGDLYGAENDA